MNRSHSDVEEDEETQQVLRLLQGSPAIQPPTQSTPLSENRDLSHQNHAIPTVPLLEISDVHSEPDTQSDEDMSVTCPSVQQDDPSQAEEGEDSDVGDEEPDGESVLTDGVAEATPSDTVEDESAPNAADDDACVTGSQQVVDGTVVIASTSTAKKGSAYDFIFTCFGGLGNPPKFSKEEMWYLIYQREVCPKTKREHWQGFVQFIARKTYKQGNFYLACGHTSMYSRKGTPAQCRRYCSKEETRLIGTTWVENGFLQPRTRGVNAFAIYTTSQRASGHSEESMLKDTLCADYMARRKVQLSLKTYSGQRLCYVVTGDTGIGKSEMIRQVSKVIAHHKNWRFIRFRTFY